MRKLAIMAVTLGWALLAGPGMALQVTPLDDSLVSVQLTARGESRPVAEEQSMREAVLATSGRVLLDNKLIRADDLMTKYLERYAPRFVVGIEVVKDDFVGGETVLESRVFVDYTKLVNDLEEKRFLYTPAYKPLFTVFMEERLEGERSEVEVARRLLSTALQVEGMKPYERDIDNPPVSINIADDPSLVATALVAAERRNIEIVLTGVTNTRLSKQEKFYYDDYFFYECEMTVSAIRVDTGDVFHVTTGRNAGSARDQADAVRLAIERTAAGVSAELRSRYNEFWPGVVQGKRDYEVLLTATNEELTRITSEYLKRLGPGTVISTRKTFDRSAVLTISTTADRDVLLEAIRSSAYPALKVVREVGNRKLEVQVSG